MVWCYVDFDGVVIKFQVFMDIGVNWCICRQFDNVVVIVRNVQFREGVQYFFRWFVMQFCCFNFEIIWQNSINGCYCYMQVLMVVWCIVDDVQQVIVVDIYFCYMQFVSVWMLCIFNYFINDYVVEAVGNWFYIVNFQVCYSDLICQCIVINCWVYLFV